MNILITGTNGYIGKHLSKVLPCRYYNITCINRDICDLVNVKEVDNFFDGKHFDVVIHCAAMGGSRLRKDDDNIFYNNVQMFLNLVRNRNHFDRLIHFGSGAQKIDSGPYGFSKRIIDNMIKELGDFHNIIIYGLFDENEFETRFIKSCVNNCLNNKPIIVNDNKIMDFFHMDDLVSVVKHYMDEFLIMTIEDNLPKVIDCSYDEKMTLEEIAYMIKDLCKSDVDITYFGNNRLQNYSGQNTEYLNNIISGDFKTRLKDNIYKLMEDK